MTGRAPRRRGLLVLAYHAISSDWDDPLSVTPETFRSQLHSLAVAGYTGVTFSQAATSLVTRKRVAITFDDAFASAAVHAPPVLEELGWPGTVFVPTVPVETREPMRWLGGVERRPDEDDALTAMTWNDVERLAEAGWEIGSHTRSHRLLSGLSADEAREELGHSRDEIIAHVERCDAVSYPWGEVVPEVMSAARRAGYSSGSGLLGRFRFGATMAVPRFAVAHGDETGPRFRAKTSPLVWGLRATPAWHLLDRARGRTGLARALSERDVDPP